MNEYTNIILYRLIVFILLKIFISLFCYSLQITISVTLTRSLKFPTPASRDTKKILVTFFPIKSNGLLPRITRKVCFIFSFKMASSLNFFLYSNLDSRPRHVLVAARMLRCTWRATKLLAKT